MPLERTGRNGQQTKAVRRSAFRAAFTMVESLFALSLIAIVGTSLVFSVDTMLDTTNSAWEQTLGLNLALQLHDEIASLPYAESGAGPTQSTLGPESGETSGQLRTGFDDMDDYNGLSQQPPLDRWGMTIGRESGTSAAERNSSFTLPTGYLDRIQWIVTVTYANSTNLSADLSSGTSNFRAYRVRVLITNSNGSQREIANVRRVYAYVPSSP